MFAAESNKKKGKPQKRNLPQNTTEFKAEMSLLIYENFRSISRHVKKITGDI
jgi:hypothetical protein